MDAPPSLPACHLPRLCSPLPSIQGSCLATLINPFNDAIDAVSFFFSQKLLEILPVSGHPQGEALTPRLLCELELAFSMGKDHLVVSVDQGHSQRSTKGHLYRFLDFQNNFLGLQIRQSSVLQVDPVLYMHFRKKQIPNFQILLWQHGICSLVPASDS